MGTMSRIEYWCAGDKHWVSETRLYTYDSITYVCKDCAGGDWAEYVPIAREVKEPRYVAVHEIGTENCYVWDTYTRRSVDVDLTEEVSNEIAALRNTWGILQATLARQPEPVRSFPNLPDPSETGYAIRSEK